MEKIFNLTQHPATKEQTIEGVVDPDSSELKAYVKDLLNFGILPTAEEIRARAITLATFTLAANYKAAMVGGAPYLMGPLTEELKKKGIRPLYSFTERVTHEITLPDGTVRKTADFRHIGWVEG